MLEQMLVRMGSCTALFRSIFAVNSHYLVEVAHLNLGGFDLGSAQLVHVDSYGMLQILHRTALLRLGDERMTTLSKLKAGCALRAWVSQVQQVSPQVSALLARHTVCSYAVQLCTRRQHSGLFHDVWRRTPHLWHYNA